MPNFNKLFNKPRQDVQPDNELSPFDKFNKANINNRLPASTDFAVAKDLTNAYNSAEDLRSKALDKVIEATDLGKTVQGADTTTAKEYGKMGLDMIAPSVTDLIPGNKIAHGIGMGIKEMKMAPKAEKTAEELIQGIRKADSYDLGRNSGLIGKPVFATAEEKALGFGKVSTPDMGGNVSHNEIMKVLNDSPTYQNLINDRELFKTNPSAYDNRKQELINKAREYLIQKAGK